MAESCHVNGCALNSYHQKGNKTKLLPCPHFLLHLSPTSLLPTEKLSNCLHVLFLFPYFSVYFLTHSTQANIFTRFILVKRKSPITFASYLRGNKFNKSLTQLYQNTQHLETGASLPASNFWPWILQFNTLDLTFCLLPSLLPFLCRVS